MSCERLIVRFAYQRGYQVVGNNRVIETFDSQIEAFTFVHSKGARVWLQWGRTVIGGQTLPYDFSASFQQVNAGRIMNEQHGPSAGTWFWTCHEGGARGRVATKEGAVFAVERAYTRYVVGADRR